MKTYRLKKDLPTFKAGETFVLQPSGLRRESDDMLAYSWRAIEKFPNILEEWFEEIETKAPRINDDDARNSVRSWASAHLIYQVRCKKTTRGLGTEVVTFEAIGLHSVPKIEFASLNADVKSGEIYSIDELCGDEEE